jgi:hypothetical protein
MNSVAVFLRECITICWFSVKMEAVRYPEAPVNVYPGNLIRSQRQWETLKDVIKASHLTSLFAFSLRSVFVVR